MIISDSICLPEKFIVSHFAAQQYYIVYMHHTFIIHSSVHKQHLGYFRFLTIVKRTETEKQQSL